MAAANKMLSGAEIFFECLKNEKVEYIFGYPGGATLKIYEKLHDVKFLEHILCRHEQGATHMAEGYAKVSGKPGVVLVTSGPGATNTVTGIADAYMDSIPLVVFTGQVPTALIGNDAFQEADIIGITRPITKHNFLVRDVRELADTIKKAFYIATSGRPGPVVVDLPKDMLNSSCLYNYPATVNIPGYKPRYTGHINQIKKAASVLSDARRPLLYVGGGVIMSGATKELRALAKKFNFPVTMTLQGLGAFPGTDPQSLGMLGMHGTYHANQAVNHCDVLLAVGARFDDRVTGKISAFAPEAYKIHIDIDPTAIDKNVVVDIPIVGDARNVLTELGKALKNAGDLTSWWRQINAWREACPLSYKKDDGKLRTPYVIERISHLTRGNAVIVSDVGQHQMWVAQYYKFNHPHSHLSSGGLGTMGFSVPAAIGATFAEKNNRPVISINGDGGFQMNIQELVTAVAYKLPVLFVVINNSFLGMVRQWQELFYDEKYSFTDLSDSNPDFVKVARAFGMPAWSTDDPREVDELIQKGLENHGGPVLLEFKVVKEDMVFPMVPAGAALSEMLIERLNPQRMM